MASDHLVPFRWPAAWTKPAMLRLLAESPFNCLVLDGAPASSTVAATARKAGLTVLEWAALGAAPLTKVQWRTGIDRIVIKDLVWPRIKVSRMSKPDEIAAAPTGAPWIDSNSWVARLARVRTGGAPVWLAFEPGKEDSEPDQSEYQIALADSAAGGARWILRLDPAFAEALARGNREAQQKWRAIAATARFFEKRRSAAYQPSGPLGILSTFSGPGEFMAHELLNLAARRGLLYRILDRSSAAAPDLRDLVAVLYADDQPPSGTHHEALASFLNNGGLVIAPKALASLVPRDAPLPCPVDGYRMTAVGKGRIAVATREWDDPYFLAADAHSLVSRGNDPVRIFNGRSLWQHYAVAPGGASALLQLVGFSGRPRDNVSLIPSRRWRSAAMYLPGPEEPRILEPVAADTAMEYRLPAFSFYAALEFRS